MNEATKNLIATIISIAFSGFLILSSQGQEYPSAYHFPLIVGILTLIPTFFISIKTIASIKKASFSKPKRMKHFIFILLLIISIQFYELLGFYLTSWLAYFLVASIYNKEKLNFKIGVKILTVSLIFMGVIYVLFAILLKVQTPQGILF